MDIRKKYLLWMAGMAAAVLLFSIFALCAGQYHIDPVRVFQELTGRAPGGTADNVHTVLFNIRIPRILMTLIAGAGLASSGAAFQSLFANPLATPDTLGVANGASFGAVLAILMGFGAVEVQLMALAFGVLAVMLVFFVTRGMGQRNPSMLMVILAGIVISSLFSALVSLVKYVADPQDVLPVITFWLIGRFSEITRASMLMSVPLILAGCILIYLLRFRLNALSLSEDEAKALGVNLRLIRILVIAAAAMTTASVVSVCGVIGWVGLLVPHIARMLFGNDNRFIVPASILFGGLFMLVIDTIARCATTSEIPVSILTAVIGAPLFIILLRRTGGMRL
ncbi:MAG: iron ABC transporter permease [Firmicutes bacterium]|nr:iron ABC transporter permease [Bacillota bacterium]